MKTLRILAALVLAATCVTAAETKLKVGDTAPKIQGVDQDEKPWKLQDVLAKNKAVLLYFYPKDDTPGCTKQAVTLRNRMETLQKDNVEVVGVSFDDCNSHREFIQKYDLNFTLLADTDGKISDAYGTRIPGKNISKRVSFLIDQNGKIVHITDTSSADVHLQEMKDAVEKLAKK